GPGGSGAGGGPSGAASASGPGAASGGGGSPAGGREGGGERGEAAGAAEAEGSGGTTGEAGGESGAGEGGGSTGSDAATGGSTGSAASDAVAAATGGSGTGGSAGGGSSGSGTAGGNATRGVGGSDGSATTGSATTAAGTTAGGANTGSPGLSPSISLDINPVCFRPGTRLWTPRGPVAIETLAPGDLVLTSEGEAHAVRWIGRQTVSTRFADPLRVQPIRIRAGAVADAVPERDLLVSPDHAIGLGGILVHASALVDGIAVTRETVADETILYLHVELDRHALLLAEGLAAESFVDNLQHLAFDNSDEREALSVSDAPVAEMDLPRAKSRRQVPPSIRRALDARAQILFPAVGTRAA
uniref:Hint domain-containing protein n=1 Tax=Aureimonas sp. AU22 TaxID=1638162 RepID=UPI000AC072B6